MKIYRRSQSLDEAYARNGGRRTYGHQANTRRHGRLVREDVRRAQEDHSGPWQPENEPGEDEPPQRSLPVYGQSGTPYGYGFNPGEPGGWHDPMDLETARRIVGERLADGATYGHAAGRARGAWDANDREHYRAWTAIAAAKRGYDPNARKPRPAQIITGRPSRGFKLEQREKTTRFPKAGMSIQSHVILLRGPVQRLLERMFAERPQLQFVEHGGGLIHLQLPRMITGRDFVDCLKEAYESVGMTPEEIRKRITANTFKAAESGAEAKAAAKAASAAYVDAVLGGDEATIAALEAKFPELPKMGKLNLLTETSKMGCYSFNLPAGPTFQGGACPASQIGFMFQTDEELQLQQRTSVYAKDISVPDFLCNGCYAIKGCYGNPSMVFVMAIRMYATRLMMQQGTFVETMVRAIEAGRAKSERRMKKATPDNRWKIPHPDYFRIHDAGDFFQPKYVEQWFEICRKLPKVNFWAPTRMWALHRTANMVFERGVPKNLALRPSAIHFGDPAPDVRDPGTERARITGLQLAGEPYEVRAPGIAAGSGSGSNKPADAWECPAYAHVLEGGGAVQQQTKEGELKFTAKGEKMLSGGTCARAHGPASPKFGDEQKKTKKHTPDQGHGCRACWTSKHRSIFYHEH